MDAKEFFEHKLAFEMDADDVMEALQNDSGITLVDTRKVEAFEMERIEGALSLPHREMNENSVKTLDPNKTYVTYCDGMGCNASTKGAYKLSKLGFKVKEMIGGLEWWKKEGFPTTDRRRNIHSNTAINCDC